MGLEMGTGRVKGEMKWRMKRMRMIRISDGLRKRGG
jgi:hypothetical protein